MARRRLDNALRKACPKMVDSFHRCTESGVSSILPLISDMNEEMRRGELFGLPLWLASPGELRLMPYETLRHIKKHMLVVEAADEADGHQQAKNAVNAILSGHKTLLSHQNISRTERHKQLKYLELELNSYLNKAVSIDLDQLGTDRFIQHHICAESESSMHSQLIMRSISKVLHPRDKFTNFSNFSLSKQLIQTKHVTCRFDPVTCKPVKRAEHSFDMEAVTVLADGKYPYLQRADSHQQAQLNVIKTLRDDRSLWRGPIKESHNYWETEELEGAIVATGETPTEYIFSLLTTKKGL